MIKELLKSLNAFIGKDVRNALIVIGSTVWLTVWVGVRIREMEMSLNRKFQSLEVQIKRLDESAWTVAMMAARDRMVSERNPTNWIPNPWQIFHDIRSGRDPTPIRMGP